MAQQKAKIVLINEPGHQRERNFYFDTWQEVNAFIDGLHAATAYHAAPTIDTGYKLTDDDGSFGGSGSFAVGGPNHFWSAVKRITIYESKTQTEIEEYNQR